MDLYILEILWILHPYQRSINFLFSMIKMVKGLVPVHHGLNRCTGTKPMTIYRPMVREVLNLHFL